MASISDLRRPVACYHEAGRALAQWFFGYATDRVVVLPRSEPRGSVQGFVEGPEIATPFGARPWTGDDPRFTELVRTRQRKTAEKKLVIIHAGIVARCVYTKRSISDGYFSGGTSDYSAAVKVLKTWFEAEHRLQVNRLAKQRTSALVRSRKGWLAISTVAAVLFKVGELSGCDLSAICVASFGAPDPPGGGDEGWPMSVRDIRIAST